MGDISADNPRTIVIHKGAPFGDFCKLTVMRLSLGPALLPVVSENAMKAADSNKEDADQTVAKCVHR
jgi:hypothetical protein